jgi:hypothetical protein
MEHGINYPTLQRECSTSPRVWSYEALRLASLGVPLQETGAPHGSRIGTVLLPHYSPEHGHGMLGLRGPSARDLGRWLHGLPAVFGSFDEHHPVEAVEIQRCFQAFAGFDAAKRRWWRAALAASKSGRPGHQRKAHAARHAAAQLRSTAGERLQAFLNAGLERREGERLNDDETVWVHLAARGLGHRRLRVCEQCSLVFEAKRAMRCPDCRRRPVRITLHPAERGGWHVGYRVGTQWASDFDRTVCYVAICRSCGRRFETTQAERQLCRNCGGGSGRVRRRRNSPSRTGRQRFRFVHADGEPLVAVSTTDAAGHAIHLQAIDGVVETDDAEIAHLLDRNHTLCRAGG